MTKKVLVSLRDPEEISPELQKLIAEYVGDDIVLERTEISVFDPALWTQDQPVLLLLTKDARSEFPALAKGVLDTRAAGVKMKEAVVVLMPDSEHFKFLQNHFPK
jgi:hypothetical protein